MPHVHFHNILSKTDRAGPGNIVFVAARNCSPWSAAGLNCIDRRCSTLMVRRKDMVVPFDLCSLLKRFVSDPDYILAFVMYTIMSDAPSIRA